MIGLAEGRELGVDLERISPRRRLEALAARTMSAEELADWEGLPEGEHQEAFFRAWTRKEAYAKALGEGLSIDPREVSPAPAAEPGRFVISGRDWLIWDLEVPDGYAGAVAAEGTDWRPRLAGLR